MNNKTMMIIIAILLIISTIYTIYAIFRDEDSYEDNSINKISEVIEDECTEEFKVLFSVVYTFTKRGNVINISTG